MFLQAAEAKLRGHDGQPANQHPTGWSVWTRPQCLLDHLASWFMSFSKDESGPRTSQSIGHVAAEAIYRLGLLYLQKNLLSEVKDSAAVRCNRCMGKAMDKA